MIHRLEYSVDKVHYGITTANRTASMPNGFSISKTQYCSERDVQSNRELFCKELGFRSYAAQHQTHGRDFRWANASQNLDFMNAESAKKSDALICHQPDIVLYVSVADCCGIVLFDAQQSVIAAVHSGWRGTQQNIVSHVVEEIRDTHGVKAHDIHAWLSPCALPCCYVVRSDVQQFFQEYCVQVSETEYLFDNATAIRDQLVACGIEKNNIRSEGICTICSQEFHSFRRDKNESGRMAVFVGLRG